jgi:MoaA/NifB/PqqE/SkfB family radical SAM enzyme
LEISAFPWLEMARMNDDAVALQNVFLHVTKACNLRCRYCYFSASRPLPDEMTLTDFERLWPDLVGLSPRKVVFTGGEPLLRPDIFDILSSLQIASSRQPITRSLNTNGFLITTEIAMQLVGLVDEVKVSLDGAREQNDWLRGTGSFDAAIRALTCLQAVGFSPRVLITVTSVVLPGLEDLLCQLVEHGFTSIKLNPFRPIGRGRHRPEWVVHADDIRGALRRAWKRCYPDHPYMEEPRQPLRQAHCGVGHFLNIMPNGDVFPCHVLTNPEFLLGNVRRDRLRDICRRTGLLAELADLDFEQLAAEDLQLARLTQPRTCLATVYDSTRSRSSWKRALPQLDMSAITVASTDSTVPSGTPERRQE